MERIFVLPARDASMSGSQSIGLESVLADEGVVVLEARATAAALAISIEDYNRVNIPSKVFRWAAGMSNKIISSSIMSHKASTSLKPYSIS